MAESAFFNEGRFAGKGRLISRKLFLARYFFCIASTRRV